MARPVPISPFNWRTSPSTFNDPSKVFPDVNPVASQWQRLASMGRLSPDFLPLLSSLITGSNRSSTTELRGNDARIALGALDEVLRDSGFPNKYERDTRSVMRTLAHDSGQVPPRYQVKPDILSVESDVIAGGASSDIRRGRLGDMEVAVKTLKIYGKTDVHDVQKRFCKECIIWMNVSHPHILQLIAVNIDPLNSRFSTISEMMLNGNIKDYTRKNPPGLDRLCLLHEVTMGLHYLHEREIIHGDLKGHNILITNETPVRACLADFGLSTLTPSAPGEMTTTTAGGTPLYMAPELLDPEKFRKTRSRPTKPTDIYALGMVVYEVITGFDPFYDKDVGTFQLVRLVVKGARPKKPDDAEKIGFRGGTWKLVMRCWETKSTKRPTVEHVLAHFERVCVSSTAVGPTPQVLTPDEITLRQRQLASHNPGPTNQQQIVALVDNEDNRKIALKFREKVTAAVIKTIDKLSKVDPNEFKGLDRKSTILLQATRARTEGFGEDSEKGLVAVEDPGVDSIRGSFGTVGSIIRARIVRKTDMSSRERSTDTEDSETGFVAVEDPGVDSIRGSFGTVGSIIRARTVRKTDMSSGRERSADAEPRERVSRSHRPTDATPRVALDPLAPHFGGLKRYQLYDPPVPSPSSILEPPEPLGHIEDSPSKWQQTIKFEDRDIVHSYTRVGVDDDRSATHEYRDSNVPLPNVSPLLGPEEIELEESQEGIRLITGPRR